MSRPFSDTQYLYGLHDPGGENLMKDGGAPGWVVITVAIGRDPGDHGSGDDYRFRANYTPLSSQGFGVIVRLNNGYAPHGTLPYEQSYDAFAQRCANFVRISRGCHLWIVGNEPNHPIEWPGADWNWDVVPPRPKSPDKVGEKLTPARYASCYRKVRDAIHALDGHDQDQVLVAAVAPWNNLTTYDDNPDGDWVLYFRHILEQLGPRGCDGITLHAYTHGTDPQLIHSTEKVGDGRYSQYHWHFKAFEDFMRAIPDNMKHLPVYITETDQGDEPWRNENSGWVREAYKAIDQWNQRERQQIRSLILYRWPNVPGDRWYIEGKQGVIEDFRQALPQRYQWLEDTSEQELARLAKDVTRLEGQVANLTTELEQLQELEAGVTQLQPATEQLSRQADSAEALQQRLTELAAEIAQIEAQILAGGAVPRPQMEDVRDTLPRHATATWSDRSLGDIHRIVVHHTATRSNIEPELIARYHVNQGMPGIKYHYLIADDGTIYWTQALEAVVAQTAEDAVNADGVAVSFAGFFTHTGPNQAQMASGARLIAWLLYTLNLSTAAVYGRSELDSSDPSRSPGRQWLEGEQYKLALLAQVQAILDAASQGDTEELARLRQRVAELEARVAELEPLAAQVEPLQQQVQDLQATVAQQSTDLDRLAAENAQLLAENARLWTIIQNLQGNAVVKPAMLDVVDSLPKHPQLRYENRTEDITTVVVHHTDTPGTFTPVQIAEYHVWGKRYDSHGNLIKGEWPGIGYHYVIAPDGTIYWCNRHETRSYHAGGANNYSLGVSLIGRFLKKNYNGTPIPAEQQLPTPEQMQSASHLIAWLMQELGITDIQRVVGHKEVSDTTCPGDQWMQGTAWKNTLHQAVVEQVQGCRKPVEHMLLFWDHGLAWAESDWRNAQDYIAHFRPTISFSTDDAMTAKVVTIVGGEAGVSGQDEARLRNSGTEVHRLAGADEAETKALLDALVTANTPYPGAPPREERRGLTLVPDLSPVSTPPPAEDEWTIPDDYTVPEEKLEAIYAEALRPRRVKVDPRWTGEPGNGTGGLPGLGG